MITRRWKPIIVTRSNVVFTALLVCIFQVLFSAKASAQDTADLQTIVRQASKECRAAKTLRRSDLDAAKEHFRQYRQLINQARTVKPDLLDAPDAATEQVLNFCYNVKKDLDRAEALPLFEQGLRECSEARIMISNAAFDDAEAKYRLYREQKEGALAISSSVLDVYENSYEVRLCDRLGEDIAQAKLDYQRQLRESAADEGQNRFADVVKSLNQAERQCRGAQSLVNDVDGYGSQTVSQITALSQESNKIRSAAVAQRDQLLAGGAPDNTTQKRIATLLEGINECQAGMPAALKRVQATLAARSKSGTDTSKPDATNRDFRQIVGAPANYPRRAISRGIEGEVLVQFTISKTGDVDEIEIVSADPEGWFERAVTDAVSKYKFQPRIKNGQPVDAKGVQRKIVFKLR